MLTADECSTGYQPVMTYTAFGEPVTYDAQAGWQVGFPADAGTRYGYDGGWGYESGLITLWGEDTTLPPVTLQHVGQRWYQPGIGRFVQRDPIGLGGGANTYGYSNSRPLTRVDPSGLINIGGGCPRCGKWAGCSCYKNEPKPQAAPPEPDLTPEQELAKVKKEYWIGHTAGTGACVVVGAFLGGPVGAIVGGVVSVLPDIVDEVINQDEPLNPLHGGDPVDWQTWRW